METRARRINQLRAACLARVGTAVRLGATDALLISIVTGAGAVGIIVTAGKERTKDPRQTLTHILFCSQAKAHVADRRSRGAGQRLGFGFACRRGGLVDRRHDSARRGLVQHVPDAAHAMEATLRDLVMQTRGLIDLDQPVIVTGDDHDGHF